MLRLFRLALAAATVTLAGCDSTPAIGLSKSPEIGHVELSLYDGTYPTFYSGSTIPTPLRPIPILRMRTLKEYNCANYELDISVQRSGATVDLTVLGFKPLFLCLPDVDPANGFAPLDLPDGDYRLRIRTDGIVDEYALRVRQDRVEIDAVRATLTIPPSESLVWRTPESSFALRCVGPTATCGQLRSRILSIDSVAEVEIPSEGVWPYAGRTYRYAPESAFVAVKDTVSAFVLAGPPGSGSANVWNWLSDRLRLGW